MVNEHTIFDWKVEAINLIKEYFESIGIKYSPKENVHKCLIDFMNLEMKLIKPAPRIIYKSSELKSRVIPLKYVSALNYIENKIRTGADLTYHLSKKTLDPSYNDLLLNDWIIRHFHISEAKSQQGQKFYDRSKYLLFALFSETQAILIDIREHHEENLFAKKELLEIIDNNWPNVLKVHEHEDAVFLHNQYSDADIDLLRRKGYTIGTTEVNGKIIINPGIGITTSGHNLHVVKRANEIMRYIQESLMEIDKDFEGMKKSLSKEVGFKINDLDICIHKIDKWPFFAVHENNSKIYIEKTY